MMNDITQTLHEALHLQCNKAQLELIELFPIPVHGDKMVRLQTLEEVIQELDSSQENQTHGYLIRVKPKKQGVPQESPPLPLDHPHLDDEIHLADGKLNSLFLLKNADLLIQNGDFHSAQTILNAVLATGEYQGIVHLKLAQCFEQDQKPESAIHHYEKSIIYHPSFEAYQKLSTLLIQQDKHREAAETLERALSQDSLTPSIRFELHKTAGNCWTRAQNGADAERNYKRALELMPHADEIRSNLAILYLQGGNTTDAKRNFQDALASNPKNHQALSGLATCYFNEGNKALAHHYFTQSLEIQINNPQALYYLVKCAYEIKTYTSAARLLAQFLEKTPNHLSLIYTLAGLEFHLGRFDEASTYVNRILDIDPQHSGATELLSMIQKFSHQNKIS